VFVLFIYGLTENLRNYGSDQNYVQRMLAAESNREAAKSIWIGALAYVPVSLIFCLIGTGLYMEANLGGANFIPPELKPDQVFPYFIRYALPAPVAGLVIAAILAAAMSSVDSSLNSCSTVLLVDVLRPLIRRGWLSSRISEIVLIRSCTVVFGVIGTGMAVVLLKVQGQEGSRVLMDVWWQYAGMAGSGLFGLFLLAWLMPRIPSWCAAVAIIACVILIGWGGLAREIESESLRWLECRLHPNLVGVAGTGAMLLIGGCYWLGIKFAGLPTNDRWNQS
jgi:SSS family solute:Na+ symporter